MPLANDSYRGLTSLADDGDLLNLAWTVDEREFLAVDLAALLTGELADEIATGLPTIGSYLVQDPYGEAFLGPTVAALNPTAAGRLHVTAAAGVIPLLHALAGLAGRESAYILGDVYPDLPHWVRMAGGRCVSRFDFATADHVRNIVRGGARLVLLDRPALAGVSMAHDELRELCSRLPEQVTVVVDEAYANYLPPEDSVVPLVDEVPNLVVVRSVSKGYGMGGLRVGFAVSSPEVTPRLRELLPPMLPSSLSLRLARAILAAGDVFGPLRSRVAQARSETLAVFDDAGVHGARPAARHVPFLFFADEDDPGPVRLRSLGILGKRHTYWSERQRSTAYRYRLSVPLRSDRMALLRAKLGGLTA
ncbi:aminotransferase class I/II-fold pyridoxal phosphate-dependent enzyme [Micromonospora sp. FIMYZ51]|uniref:aminotransferase class I/II-fold pyridoxal phosphate-dependent enzyme n=1 Tax=Micromonospora sp. FIMYZ51 TaxID=3051832 RepID=UPI00311F1725